MRTFRTMLVREGSGVEKADNASCIAKLCSDMQDLDHEEFRVLMLSSRNEVIGKQTVSMGTLDQTLIHPREVFKAAILASAAGIILVHNHPSGDSKPSEDDKSATRKLNKASEILGIELLDHLIIGCGNHTSLKEEGLMGC